ncbi:protein of unknown function [Methylocella tundrae]|uniref:Uncharacterized protein n=1 Tax=Methylocella tundrae TaxID=227605 RepID=A0A4U8YV45_METTU|nr:protein of unknown function [Methylocella tundrae]
MYIYLYIAKLRCLSYIPHKQETAASISLISKGHSKVVDERERESSAQPCWPVLDEARPCKTEVCPRERS